MKKNILLVFVLALFPQISLAEKIVIAADPWCPYNCEPKSANEGAMIEMAKKVFSEKGIEVEYISMPWARAVAEARKGNINAIAGALKSDAPDFVFPEYPQGIITLAFFTSAEGKWRYNDINSLKNVSLGVIQGYSYGQELDEYITKNGGDFDLVQVVGGDDALENNIQKLVSGRVDVYLEDMNVFNYHIKEKVLKDKVRFAGIVIPPEQKSNYLYFAFSPKNDNSEKYAKILTEGMKKIVSDGSIKTILKKYNFDNWTSKVR